MNNIRETKENNIICEELGTVHVSMYKDSKTNLPFFVLDSDNENVLPLSYVIEDCLYEY